VGTADAVGDNAYMKERNNITNCRHVFRRLHTGICILLHVRWVELTLFNALFFFMNSIKFINFRVLNTKPLLNYS